MSDAVNQIKERLSIVDVVSSYMELQPAGKNMKGKSPFTNEKTPSFYVSPDRGMYYCFSSSQGGDIFNFVQEMEGVDFKGALKILADKAGVELVPEDPKKKTARDRQYDLLESATAFFQDWLGKHNEAFSYLTDRGVKPQTIGAWRIGYAPGPPQFGWRDGKVHLTEKGFTDAEMQKGGLIKGGESGKEMYDVFRDRVMFPIFDSVGKVVAYSGRMLTKDDNAPKYVNSPETELFNKSEILYGYHAAKQGIRTYDFSLIVEGQFDVVLAHQAGYSNTVAVSGTALTAHHVMLLQRLSNRVVLALDSDRAGIAAVKKAADLMLARGMDVKVVTMPEGEDPADIIGRDVNEFKAMVGNSTHVIEYLLGILKRTGGDDRTIKLKAREEVLPYVAKIPNRIDQEHFEGLIAEQLDTTKDAIRAEVERIIEKLAEEPVKASSYEEPTQMVETSPETETNRLREVYQYLTVLKTVVDKKYQQGIDEVLEAYAPTNPAPEDARIISKLSFEIESRLASLPVKQLADDIIHSLNEYRTLYLKQRLREYKTTLQAAEAGADEPAVEVTMSQIAEVQKKLSEPAYTHEIFTSP